MSASGDADAGEDVEDEACGESERLDRISLD